MLKTIDFYEIEQNPEILAMTLEQLIGKDIDFIIRDAPTGFIGDFGDYIITDDIITLIIDGSPKDIDYSFDGYLEIEFDDFVNKITVFYRRKVKFRCA